MILTSQSISAKQVLNIPATLLQLNTSDCHLLHAQGWDIDAAGEFEVAGGGKMREHVAQVAGDGHFVDGESDLAILDPESGGGAAVVACHDANARSH